MSGLVVNGVEHDVPGLTIVNWRDADWARLGPLDFRMRRKPWVRQLIVHSTQGKHPQRILPGRGPGGTAKRTADYWRKDPAYSGAHTIVDSDETVACLADLAAHCAFHATVSNEWSVGIEMRQEPNGDIYEAVLDTTVALCRAMCTLLDIPFQIAADAYRGEPIERMRNGGPDCVGIFGHRDNTTRRGQGDPGDEIYRRVIAAGAEPLNFGAREDLTVWMHRQARLNSWGAKLTTDGICGPATIRAMRSFDFAHGREIDTAVEDPRG